LSIRSRLNVLVIALLLTMYALVVGAMVHDAGPRIAAEEEGTLKFTKKFIETSMTSLEGTSDPLHRLSIVMNGLHDLRHVQIYREDVSGNMRSTVPTDAHHDNKAPEWFIKLVRPAQPTLTVPIMIDGVNHGRFVVTPDPTDEISQIWQSIVSLAIAGFLVAVASLVLVSWLISRTLKPLNDLGGALTQLEEGQYKVEVPEDGPAELSAISIKLNKLAAALNRSTTENRRLAEKVICVQDDERKGLARELHDELGPYLFAIRAGASSLKSEVLNGRLEADRVVSACRTMLERLDAVQQVNRRVLQKLRPVGLAELGLPQSLRALVAMLSDTYKSSKISLSLSDDLPTLDETACLTIYRIVQEGVTNACRHGGATEVHVEIAPFAATADGALPERSLLLRRAVRVSVGDNGVGLSDTAKPGFGLVGMGERVWALGGVLKMENREAGGALVEALIPSVSAS
jgi:two-component system sensor histidine kinase UhpB